MARRLLRNCGQIMRYGVANDLVLRNPIADLRPADILKPRKKRDFPHVTARELGPEGCARLLMYRSQCADLRRLPPIPKDELLALRDNAKELLMAKVVSSESGCREDV